MKVLIGLIFILLSLILAMVLITPANEPDQITKSLCRQYAERDHEKELAPERWQWFLDQGIDPNTDFDWYQSCIKHNTKAVAD